MLQLLCRAENTYATLLEDHPETIKDFGSDTNLQIELGAKYAGYIERQEIEVGKLAHKHEGRTLPYELVADRIADYLRESRAGGPTRNISRAGFRARIEGIELAGADALRVH